MTARLSRAEVERIAGLAHLALTEEEIDLFARQLAGILTYVEQLDRLDTASVAPTSHVLAGQAVLRPDAPQPGLPRDEVLAAAPDGAPAEGLFRVPRVIAR
jgi:aspartyl-tRNA(Asn)/glutamyl-tRNA(Gln) amidotransferase subunit C